ncbi:hypothetical protein [Nitrosospira sp. Nsp1]|nr:hypothetical protein [Nitrosospira sp. Nsp1]SCX48773.1 hypothetical protein SAMN05720354_10829 [Nitrosospira sp. Nsp1]
MKPEGVAKIHQKNIDEIGGSAAHLGIQTGNCVVAANWSQVKILL